jgi:hypothetical protein
MKLFTALTLLGLGIGATGIVLAQQGCSSSDNTSSGGSTLGRPPAKPSAEKTTSTARHNFALQTLHLGDADRNGVASNNAWKKYGYNIDGLNTVKGADGKLPDNVCTPVKGGPKIEDGENGIDNAFGKQILPVILTAAGADAPKKINEGIADGSFTIMLDVVGLSDDPKQTATGLTGQIFAGAKFSKTGAKPTFTPSDNWPVVPNLLVDPNNPASGSKIKFTDAYIVGGTFVNADPSAGGSGSKITLSLAISGVSLDVTVNQAIITFSHEGTKAKNGVIAGVIDTEELISGLKKVAGRISDSLCSGSAFDSIADQIRQASDILADGTNRAGVPCTGISIGLGFEASEIGIPSTLGDLGSPGEDKCAPKPDGGTDGGGGGDASDAATD